MLTYGELAMNNLGFKFLCGGISFICDSNLDAVF